MLGTNSIDHHRTADYVTFAAALAGHRDRFASQHDNETAPAILLIGGDPTNENPLTAWNIRADVRLNRAKLYIVNHQPIKLRRQARLFAQINELGYNDAVSTLAGGNGSGDLTKLRDAVKSEEKIVILIGSELRGASLKALIDFGLTLPNAKFALLSDYVNAHGASDMGLLPDMLPGYVPLTGSHDFGNEYGERFSNTPGLDMVGIFDAAAAGNLGALYVVNANPVARYSVDPASLANTFVVVHDMFMTETAALADVIFPSANLYEKSGSVTNSYGDLQLVKKASDRSGVRTDLELIVRVADKMGANVRELVPFGKRSAGIRADLGQTRGAQSGEADRHAVWLTTNNLEPKLSPFDPFAVLDEIQRLVPGYDLLRLQLMSGNDQHLAPAAPSDLVQIETDRRDLVLPAEDTLFTSGTLGRFSPKMMELADKYAVEPAGIPAD